MDSNITGLIGEGKAIDSTIIAALITAAACLLAATMPYLIKAFNSSRRLCRYKGIWTGNGSQKVVSKDAAPEYQVRLEVDSKKKILLTLHRKDTKFDFANELKCTALVIDNEFLLAQYQNTRPEKRQFGSVLLRLSSDGANISGIFVGYGIKSEEAVTGSMVLARV